MAKFEVELPTEIIKSMTVIYDECPEIFSAMTQAGGQVVQRHILNNMRYAFDQPEKLAPYLKVTRPYRTYGGKFVNTKVAFYGYYRNSALRNTDKPYINRSKATEGHVYRTGYRGNTVKVSSGRKSNEYIQEGVPVPLIVIAREYGTSSGEAKKPFVRKAFNQKSEIEIAMYEEQVKRSGGLLV